MNETWPLFNNSANVNDHVKGFFFRKYDAFFSWPQKCAKNYPEKEITRLRSV